MNKIKIVNHRRKWWQIWKNKYLWVDYDGSLANFELFTKVLEKDIIHSAPAGPEEG